MFINSLLETDFYEFLMQQIFVNKFSDVDGKLKFKCRNKNLKYSQYAERLKEEVDNLCELRFTNDEIEYLSNLKTKSGNYIFHQCGDSYLEFLRNFQFNKKYFTITDDFSGNLDIEINGPIRYSTFYEVFLLRIISFLNTEFNTEHEDNLMDGRFYLNNKIKKIMAYTDSENVPFKFADFGTRRSYSFNFHDYLVRTLVEKIPDSFVGTSNVYFARKYGIKPIGTMAHKFIQMFQGIKGVSIKDSQKEAFQSWAEFYRGDLGIALSDTLGDKKFFNDFDFYFAKLFDGVRNDSGDPYEWGEKMVKLYENYNIDPKTKTLVFSNGLSIVEAIQLNTYFKNKINISFGIGTNLTNDCKIEPLNIVIKLIEANGNSVAKISADSSKEMCEDKMYLDYLRYVCES